jgi:hypothetical protein
MSDHEEPRRAEAMTIEFLANAIAAGQKRSVGVYFWRRALDKSCYEVVKNTDPDAIGEDMIVVDTLPNHDGAQSLCDYLRSVYVARAALEALKQCPYCSITLKSQ